MYSLKDRAFIHFRDVCPHHQPDLAAVILGCTEDELREACVELTEEGLLEYDDLLDSWMPLEDDEE